jgi:MoaA/NifB/PqqE/SkfB family radical SAM enzyme
MDLHLIDTILKKEKRNSLFFDIAVKELLDKVCHESDNKEYWDCFLSGFLRGKIHPDTPPVRYFFPFLSLTVNPSENNQTIHQKIEYFKVFFERESMFLKNLEEYLSLHSTEIRDYFSSLRLITGIQPEIIGILKKTIDQADLDQYLNSSNRSGIKKQKRQITLIPTFRCTMQCSYCVNKDLFYQDLTGEGFNEIFSWLENNGCDLVSFSGGEPTVYWNFCEIISLLIKRYEIYFATNFLFGAEVRDVLTQDRVSSLTVHLLHPTEYTEEQKKVLLNNIQVFQKQKKELRFRYNITQHEDLKKWEPLISFIKNCGYDQIYVALTVPGHKRTNEFVYLREVKEMGAVIDNFIRYSAERKVRVILSKPIPPCCLNEKTDSLNIHSLKCNIFQADYTYNVTVLPNLKVTPCFAVMKEFKKLTEYKDWDEMKQDIKPYVVGLINKPLFHNCYQCYLYLRGMCMGGCLTYKTGDPVDKETI